MADYTDKKALILGASGGIGGALLAAYEATPAFEKTIGASRRDDGLDLTQEQSVAAYADAIKDAGPFDIIINASGALEIDGVGPEKSLRAIDAAHMTRAFQINAIGAALALKYFSPLLHRKRRAVFATLSARVGSIGDNRLGGWISYRASKAALNQIVRCASIELSRTHAESVVVALHPGTIETSLTERFAKGRYTASPAECATNLIGVMQSLSSAQSGGFYDYAGKEIPW